jgi:hypothetical protein
MQSSSVQIFFNVFLNVLRSAMSHLSQCHLLHCATAIFTFFCVCDINTVEVQLKLPVKKAARRRLGPDRVGQDLISDAMVMFSFHFDFS